MSAAGFTLSDEQRERIAYLETLSHRELVQRLAHTERLRDNMQHDRDGMEKRGDEYIALGRRLRAALHTAHGMVVSGVSRSAIADYLEREATRPMGSEE